MSENEKIKGQLEATGGRPSYLNYDPQSNEWQQEWQKFQVLLKETGIDNSEISIFRRGKRDSKFVFVETTNNDGFSMQSIAERFGGGKYQIKSKIRGEWGPAIAIEIDDRIVGDLDKPATTQNGAPLLDPIALIQAAKSLMPDTGKQDSVMVAMMERQEAARAETTKMIIGLAGALAPVFVAMFSKPVDKESRLLEILLPRMLDQPHKNIQSEIASSLNLMKELRAMAETAEKPDEGLIDKLGKLLMGAAPAVISALAQPQMPMRQIADAPETEPPMNTSTPAQMGGSGGPPPSQPVPDVNAIVPHIYAGMLTRAAANNADPATWAEMIEDVADDAQWEALIGLLMREDWLQILTTQLPALAPHGAWLIRLREEILRDDEPETAEPEIPARESTLPIDSPKEKAVKNGARKKGD